jgi:hypothetical protein
MTFMFFLCFGFACVGFFLGFVLCAAIVQNRDEQNAKLRDAMTYADGFYDGRRAAGAEL